MPRRSSDWEILFDMQHYGLPTRLLDWSENLGIATFFAAVYNEKLNINTNAAIFLIDPAEINKYSGLKFLLDYEASETDYISGGSLGGRLILNYKFKNI